MTESRDDFIENLVADLRPVNAPGDTLGLLMVWLACAGAYCVALMLATGGWREGALASLATTGTLLAETMIGIGAIVTLAHSALRSAIPDATSEWRRFRWPLAIVSVWLLLHVNALWQASGPVSMLGKREHCFWQSVLFSLPSFALLSWWIRGLMPLRPRVSAAAAGAAAAALPAALMQLACLYDPVHALSFHVTPIAAYAVAGALLGGVILRSPSRPRPRTGRLH